MTESDDSGFVAKWTGTLPLNIDSGICEYPVVMSRYGNTVTVYIGNIDKDGKKAGIFRIVNMDKSSPNTLLLNAKCTWDPQYMIKPKSLQIFVENPMKYRLLMRQHPQLFYNIFMLNWQNLFKSGQMKLSSINDCIYQTYIALRSIHRENCKQYIFNNPCVMMKIYALLRWTWRYSSEASAMNPSEYIWFRLFVIKLEKIVISCMGADKYYQLLMSDKILIFHGEDNDGIDWENDCKNQTLYTKRIQHDLIRVMIGWKHTERKDILMTHRISGNKFWKDSKMFHLQDIKCGNPCCGKSYNAYTFGKIINIGNKKDIDKLFDKTIKTNVITRMKKQKKMCTFRACKQCRRIYYCSKHCQKISWIKFDHKSDCKEWSSFFATFY